MAHYRPSSGLLGGRLLLLVALLAATAQAVSFTVAGGQVFTPGFTIVDAPQPGTPLGGDTLQVALDVTADGKLPLPPDLAASSPSLIHNITMFLYSYDAQRNFTISNGTASAGNASLGAIMDQEPGSTVKHVDWVWPDCLVGNGQPIALDSARGVYNISIRQSFRLNNVDYYTVFDLPISVTNEIASATGSTSTGARPACADLENPLLTPDQVNATAADAVGVLFAPGGATQVEVTASDPAATGTGLGPSKPVAVAGDGLGSAASAVAPSIGALSWLLCAGMALLVAM